MNKTAFKKYLTQLTRSVRSGQFVGAEDTEILKTFVGRSKSWAKWIGPKVRFKVASRSFGHGKPVKIILLITPGGLSISLFKGKLVEEVFPRASQWENSNTDLRKITLSALRAIIQPQIKEFRVRVTRGIKVGALSSVCPLSGVNLKYCATAVDHIKPFRILVEEWMEINKINSLASLKTKGKGQRLTLKDETLAQSWYDFHKDNASLQLVESKANVVKSDKFDLV